MIASYVAQHFNDGKRHKMTRASFDELLRRKLHKCSSAQGCAASRCAFKTAWKEIRAALVKGYTVKLIWEVLHETGRINIKYVWFSQLVSRQLAREVEIERRSALVDINGYASSSAAVPGAGETKSPSRKPLQTSPRPLKGAEAKRELSKRFGQARSDLTLDDFFGLTDRNVLDVL